MGKRIRYPKIKKEQEEIKEKEKEGTKENQKTHFVLDVHNSVMGNVSKIGK